MSRRKQSNPKPLLKNDCENTAGEMEILRDQDADSLVEKQPQVTETNTEPITSRSPSTVGETSPSFSNCSSPVSLSTNDNLDHTQSEPKSPKIINHVDIKQNTVLPKLRLNVMLASDPALQPEAKDLKTIRLHEINVDSKNNHSTDLDDIRHSNDNQHSRMVDDKSDQYMPALHEPVINIDVIPRVPGFMCGPCGIKFSSISTLEAHQTYYCTHRKDADESNISKHSSADDGNGTEPSCKSIKTGKQYACTQCSYSADKKVSLNRHMRMHQTSPTPSSVTSNGDECPSSQIQQIDRYCTDCDIRFSSTKTYRAHKQHYCGSRHRDGTAATTPVPKSNASKSGSQSPPEMAKSPPVVSPPYIALPTNPIVIIPYSIIRGASIIPGPLSSVSSGTSDPDSTCFIFKNGSLSPFAHATTVSSQVSPVPQRSQTPNKSGSTIISGDNAIHAIPIELMKIKKKESSLRDSTIPLDLSVRRLSSELSRERSMSFSSCLSGDHGRLSIDMMMEGKENLSIDSNSVTPEQIVCAPSLPGSPSLTPSPKRSSHSPRGILAASPNSIHSSSHPQPAMIRQLIPSDLAARLSEPSLNLHTTKSLLDRQSAELALRLSTSSNTSANHQDNSTNKSTGLTLNKKPGTSNSLSLGQPHIYVKQGVSKCKECNIVFCKHENYLAHKKHYCQSRNLDDKDGTKPSPPPSPSPTNSTGAVAPLAYQQLICAACGIKFTSLDNLSAHQLYYCTKRIEIPLQTPQKEKCTKCKSIHEPNGQCQNQSIYKCPICDTISANAAESRRHIETHVGVKAFRCSICRYKGNTLRGMRTHIRMHFDKKSTDFNEEHYISCILEEDVLEIPPVAQMVPTESVQPQLHSCDKCNYSSSYKGNVVRHIKLVHSQSQQHSTSPKLGEGGESLLHIDNSTKPTSVSLTIKTEPGEPIETNRSSSDSDVIKEQPLKRIKLESKEINIEEKSVTDVIESDYKTAEKPIVAITEPKYCDICDIKFNYLNTFIAHKKFYCKSVTTDIENNSSAITQPQSATAVLTRTAETSVL